MPGPGPLACDGGRPARMAPAAAPEVPAQAAGRPATEGRAVASAIHAVQIPARFQPLALRGPAGLAAMEEGARARPRARPPGCLRRRGAPCQNRCPARMAANARRRPSGPAGRRDQGSGQREQAQGHELRADAKGRGAARGRDRGHLGRRAPRRRRGGRAPRRRRPRRRGSGGAAWRRAEAGGDPEGQGAPGRGGPRGPAPTKNEAGRGPGGPGPNGARGRAAPAGNEG